MTEHTPSIMERLKSATAELHRIAETRELQRNMLRGTLPRELYIAYLSQLFLVHQRLEAHLRECRQHVPAIAKVFRGHHQREPNLRSDLEFFCVDPEAIEPAPATSSMLARIDEIAETEPVALLGLFYVLEGSMNGNTFVARSLSRAYGLADGPGLSYLNPYGDKQKELWQTFKDEMSALDFTEAQRERLLAAAQLMFQGVIALSDELMEPALA